MDCSFTPSGHWFVFDADTGATLTQGFRNKESAKAWMWMQTFGKGSGDAVRR